MIVFIVALLTALVCTPCVILMARRGRFLDAPNHRSSHSVPTPTGAGVAVAVAAAIGLAVGDEWTLRLAVLLAGSLALGAVGLADDRWGLSPIPRLVAQVCAPSIGVVVLGSSGAFSLVVLLGVSVVFVAGYVNAFNFMDGINGISGLQAFVLGIFLAGMAQSEVYVALSGAGLAVAGAALGFLPYNFLRPLIFLGDVGSYFIGAWLAGLALLVVDSGVSALVVLPPFLLYILDTSTVIVRRARRGEPLMEAHREHVYQRLVRLGWSHESIALLCGTVTAICAVLGFLVRDRALVAQVAALAASLALVLVYLWLPYRSRRHGDEP